MLHQIKDIESAIIRADENEANVLRNIQQRIDDGEELLVYKKVTKRGDYINIYQYDKTKWRHILVDSIKV